MTALWRAAGYIAFDECTWGHTTAALRYRDADGLMRYHTFDPQRRYYHWDATNQRVGTWSLPVMRGMVFRHLTAPQHLHSLRTSLRLGERIERRWDNGGHIVPSGKDKRAAAEQAYYAWREGATKGVYAAVGEEVQVLRAETRPETFAGSLHEGSANVACSAAEPGRATLHPQKPGAAAAFVYRLAPPYVVADARCEATLVKRNREDLCRVSISRDGAAWSPVYTQETLGEERVVLEFGRQAWEDGRPNVYTAYDCFLKIECQTAGDPRDVGLRDLEVPVFRMLNKRTLPNLRPGANVLRVTADRMQAGYGLELAIEYRVDGAAPPDPVHPAVPALLPDRRAGGARGGSGGLRPAVQRGAAPHGGHRAASPAGRRGRAVVTFAGGAGGPCGVRDQFRAPRPHGAAECGCAAGARRARDLGFLPAERRGPRRRRGDAGVAPRPEERRPGTPLAGGGGFGAYPKALDALLAELPAADGDQTLFLCKALARRKDPRAIGPLLEKWKRAPGGAPGTRYIPDVLAAIGDRSVVGALVAPLPKCRFDYRLHIVHALGILGGAEAERTLAELAAHDPFPAVRQEAAEALQRFAVAPPLVSGLVGIAGIGVGNSASAELARWSA